VEEKFVCFKGVQMRFEDVAFLESLLDHNFLKLQGYSFPSKFKSADLAEIFKEIMIKRLNPHPLFDPEYLTEKLGYDWLLKFINQNDDFGEVIMPNKLIDYNFVASFNYTSCSAHINVFNIKSESLSIDFDANLYRNVMQSVEGFMIYNHIFADYSFRSGYKGSNRLHYDSLFATLPLLTV